MAFVPRRMAIAVAAVASIFGTVIMPSAAAYASSVPAPTPTGPANTTSIPLKQVVLTWNAVPGASLYEVQVSPNDEWTNNTVTLPNNGQTVNTVLELPVGLPHAAYFWHVRAQVDGVWGPFSAPWQFLREWAANNIAILKAPTSADPTVKWAPLSDVSLYQVSFIDETTGTQLDCFTEQTSFTPYETVASPTLDAQSGTGTPIPETLGGDCFSESSLIDGHSYGWAILAIDDTSAAAVTTSSANPDPLACKAVLPECGGFLGNTYISPTPFTFGAPTGGTFDDQTTATGLRTTWHPAASAGGTPCDTTSPCPVTPTFSWDPVAGANYYRVDVYLDPLHTNDYRTYTTAWPELTPRDFYLDAQASGYYRWTVQPGLCTIGCSAPADLDTCKAGTAADFNTTVVNPIVPNAGGVVISQGGLEIAGSGSYQITLSEPVGAGSPRCVIASAGSISGDPVPNGSTITFTYVPPAEGNVTFKIVNQGGTMTNESESVTVDENGGLVQGKASAVNTFAKRSGAVTLTSPANGATTHGGLTFTWQDFLVSGGMTALEARNYELQVSQDPNFDTTIIDNSDIDLTQYTDPAVSLENGSYYWRVIAIEESGEQLTWSAIHHFTVNAKIPTVSFATGSGVGVGKNLLIQASDRLAGLKASTLKVVPKGRSSSYAVAGSITRGAAAKSYIFTPDKPLGTGVTYVLVPKASLVDDNGNPVVVTGGGVRTTKTAKATSPGWHYSRGWQKLSSSQALSGQHYFAAGAGRVARLTVGGSEAHLFACVGPDFGHITIAVGGHSQTISEHQKFTQCGVEIWHRALPNIDRKLTVSVVSGVGNIDEVQVD